MCAILGRVSKKRQESYSDIFSASSLMDHRGPDSSGQFVSLCKRVIFAHRRLAIVDLSNFASQPMSDQKGIFTIVFNGEIYNHAELRVQLQALGYKFFSNSDTEVLLAGYSAWKEKILNRINGPFAFAIFDKLKNTVFMARDRMGEKPLFLMEENDELVFSSELKPLIKLSKVSKKFNAVALVSYLSRGYPMQGTSILDGIETLPPGHFLQFDLNNAIKIIAPFWTPSFVKKNKIIRIDEGVEELKKLFADSVKLQMQCDVPACVLLSGGLDSSLITAFASEQTKSVKTFNVKFSGFSAFDEAKEARFISDYFGTTHTEIECSNPSPDILETIACSIDTPINDSSLIPTYTAYQEVSQICKVALGGDGGDELFGGYKHYSRLLLLDNFIGFCLPILKKTTVEKIKRWIPNYYRSRNWILTLSHNLVHQCPNLREIFDPGEAGNFLRNYNDLEKYNIFQNDWDQISSAAGSVLDNAIKADLKGYFSESILVKTDRTSMMNSVESRSPFLDVNIVNFALNTVPNDFKTSQNGRKIILRELGRQILPKTFDFKRKLGFNLPLGNLIRKGEWSTYFKNIIYSNYDFIDKEKCISLFNEHLAGRNHADKLFGLVLLIRWAQANNISSVNYQI